MQMRLNRARNRTTLCTLALQLPPPQPEQGTRLGGRLAPPQWWASKSACTALDQAILLSFARREPLFFGEKWRSVSPMLTVAARSVRSVKLLIIERSIISWQRWTTLARRAFRQRKRRRRLLPEGVDS